MGETGLEEKRKERKLKYLVVLQDQYRNKQSRSVSDLEGVGQLLQDGSGQPVPVERQRLQVRQGGQRGQQQQEGLVRQLGEAQLQADHRGGVTLQVRTQPLHVPAGQRDARQVQRPVGQGGRQHRLQAAQTDVWKKIRLSVCQICPVRHCFFSSITDIMPYKGDTFKAIKQIQNDDKQVLCVEG